MKQIYNISSARNIKHSFGRVEKTEEPNMANESNIRHYNGEISLSHKARKRIREAKKKARPGKIHKDIFGHSIILICN